MDDEAISGAVDAFTSVRLTSHTGTTLLRLLWHVTCGDTAATSNRLHTAKMKLNADAAMDAPGTLDPGGNEKTPPGLAGVSIMPAVAPSAGRAGQSLKGLCRMGGSLSGRSGAQWERRLIRHLYTELESCKRDGASSRPSLAPLVGSTGAMSADSAAASQLWAAALLLRLSLCHDGRAGASGGAGGAGGAHASEVLVALRVLQSTLAEASLRPLLIHLALPALVPVLHSTHAGLSFAASGLLLVAAASGEYTEEALAALSTSSFFRAAAAALRREGSSSEGDDSVAATLCVLLQEGPPFASPLRPCVWSATGDGTYPPASATLRAIMTPPTNTPQPSSSGGLFSPTLTCVTPPLQTHFSHTPFAQMLSTRPELRPFFDAPDLRAALVGLQHQHASAPFLAANVRSIIRNTKDAQLGGSAAAAPAIAAGGARADAGGGATDGAGAADDLTRALDDQCLRYERLERRGLGGQLSGDEGVGMS
jgi:hypothetical protein